MTEAFGRKNDPNSISKPGPDAEKAPAKPGEPVKIVQFIDISRYQPNMRWDAVVKHGFQAVVAKCVDGAAGVDQMFLTHAKNAKAKGLPFGGYAFNRFSADPIKQAEHFAKHVTPQTNWIVADIEFDKSSSTLAKFGDKYTKHMDDYAADHSIKFLQHLEKLTGVVPWVYLNAYHFTGFKNPERFLKYPCWVSNYIQKRKAVKDLDLNLVHLPKPYTKQNVVAWQWSDVHPAAKEITGDAGLDANVFFGGLEQLKELANG